MISVYFHRFTVLLFCFQIAQSKFVLDQLNFIKVFFLSLKPLDVSEHLGQNVNHWQKISHPWIHGADEQIQGCQSGFLSCHELLVHHLLFFPTALLKIKKYTESTLLCAERKLCKGSLFLPMTWNSGRRDQRCDNPCIELYRC